MNVKTKKFALHMLKYLMLIVVLGFVARAMYRELANADAKDWAALHPNWLLVFAAGLCLVGVNSVQMISYRSLLRAYGASPTWRQMAAIAWVPPLGKYIPGKVFALLGAMAMLKRFAINTAIAISVVIMLDAFSVIVGLIISSPLLMQPPISTAFPLGKTLGPIAIALGILSLSPPAFGRILRFGLDLIKRPPLTRMPTWGEYAIPVACAMAQWLFAGGALWLCAHSLAPTSIDLFPKFVMIAACAMTLSYLALFAPGGIGVREAIFLPLLAGVMEQAPTGSITIVIIMMRVLQTLVELALAGLGGWMLKRETRSDPSAGSSPV